MYIYYYPGTCDLLPTFQEGHQGRYIKESITAVAADALPASHRKNSPGSSHGKF